jgi:hypothetical protein
MPSSRQCVARNSNPDNCWPISDRSHTHPVAQVNITRAAGLARGGCVFAPEELAQPLGEDGTFEQTGRDNRFEVAVAVGLPLRGVRGHGLGGGPLAGGGRLHSAHCTTRPISSTRSASARNVNARSASRGVIALVGMSTNLRTASDETLDSSVAQSTTPRLCWDHGKELGAYMSFNSVAQANHSGSSHHSVAQAAFTKCSNSNNDIENTRTRGRENEWQLTPAGKELETAIRHDAGRAK